jgi:hypothetical protein
MLVPDRRESPWASFYRKGMPPARIDQRQRSALRAGYSCDPVIVAQGDDMLGFELDIFKRTLVDAGRDQPGTAEQSHESKDRPRCGQRIASAVRMRGGTETV